MKKYIIMALGIVLSMQQVSAQSSDKQSQRSERKELRKERLEQRKALTSKMLEKRTFVLEAGYLSNNRGARRIANPTLNFIKVDEEHAVIQIGNNMGIGHNGVGGVTATGRISSWDVQQRRNGSYFVGFNVITSIGHYSIRMNVSVDGSARATLSGIQYGSLTYEGNLVPAEMSRVYRGRSI